MPGGYNAGVAKVDAEALWRQFWDNPDDTATLRVWADAMSERGDPRGELVQLSLVDKPTDETRQKRVALQKKYGGKLVGPAREFLREWRLGRDGLVGAARCEADKLVAGFAAIATVHPRLVLTITSLKKKAVIDAFAKLSLAPIYYVDFTAIIGSHGGTQLSDKTLAAIAPAFRGVRHLALSCRGFANECFTPAGLTALGEHTDALELLWIDYFQARDETRITLPRPDAYLEAMAKSKGFAKLKSLHFLDAKKPGPLKVKHFNAGKTAPTTAAEVAALVG
jgi:uncharacterized protein (TIGR02996 family)